MSNQCICIFLILAIVSFPFYVLYLQTIYDSSNYPEKESIEGKIGGQSRFSYQRDLESLLTVLEEEHQLLQNVITNVETLINHATDIIDESNENSKELKLIKQSLLESKHHLEVSLETEEKHSVPTISTESNVIPSPMILRSQDSASFTEPSVLVVGGTDGSGTRRVVQILTDLGVLMVSEDPETYDIHADLVGGWPPTVLSVLKETHSLEYSVDKLSKVTHERASTAVKKIITQAEKDSVKPTSFTLAVGGQLPRPKDAIAKGVKFGFKAPVAMTLTPLWDAAVGNFKLLHVLRDGRDIAFSVNQGPVEKFYDAMYGPRSGQPQEQAIRLWSDWNTQVYKWAKQRINQNLGKSFEYYAIHTEDLVDQNPTIRFAATYWLAKWVDSNLSDDEICCVVVKSSEFLGSHDRTPRDQVKSDKQVKSRYGKWKDLVRNNGQLERSLLEIGGEGLKLFGYEPHRKLASHGDVTPSGYRCNMTEKICQDRQLSSITRISSDVNSILKESTDNAEAKKYSYDNKCKIYIGVDFRGGDYSDRSVRADDPSGCCRSAYACAVLSDHKIIYINRECIDDPKCRHFTFDVKASLCYLKISRGTIVSNDVTRAKHLISGDK